VVTLPGPAGSSGWSCTFDVVPLSATETIQVLFAEGALADFAGNANPASNTLEFLHDSAPLTVLERKVLTSTRTSISPVHLSVRFSDGVLSFSVEDLQVTGGLVSCFQPVDSAEYTFHVTPAGPWANINVRVLPDAVQDVAQNGNLASDTLLVLYNAVPPTVLQLSTPAPSPSALRSIPFAVTFSEPVQGFTAESLRVTGGLVTAVTATDRLGAAYPWRSRPRPARAP